MKIYKDLQLREFEPWMGAKLTATIIHKANKDREFETLIEELYPNGLSETELNDILWFQDEWIYEMLDIKEDAEWEKIIRGG